MFFSGIADEAGKDINVQIKAHKELGWSYIEMRNVGDKNFIDIPEDEFEKCCEKLNEAGIKVSCFASQIANWARKITNPFEKDLDELKRAIPRMHKLGTKYIRIMSYPNDGLSEEDWAKEAIRRIKELTRIAEDGGIVLAHENCSGWAGEGPEQTLRLLEEVNSDALKLIWDTGNPVGHKQDPFDYYTKVRDYVVYVHIKDGKLGENGEMEYTYPGEGNGMVKEVLKDLLSRGYDGGISIEPHLAVVIHKGGEGDKEELAYQKYIEYGKRLMKLIDDINKERA